MRCANAAKAWGHRPGVRNGRLFPQTFEKLRYIVKKFFEFGLILRRIVQRREIFAEGYLVKLSNLQDRHQCRELVFCFVAIDGQMYAIYKIFLGGLIMCDPQITIALCKFFDELFVFVISVFFGRDLKKNSQIETNARIHEHLKDFFLPFAHGNNSCCCRNYVDFVP